MQSIVWDGRRATVLKFFGGSKPIHVSTLYRGVHSGRYPPPMNISGNAVRWLGHECRAARQRMRDERGKRSDSTRRLSGSRCRDHRKAMPPSR